MFVDRMLAQSRPDMIVARAIDLADAGHASGTGQLDALVARYEERVAEARHVAGLAAKLTAEINDGTAQDLDATSDEQVERLERHEDTIRQTRQSLMVKARENERQAGTRAPHLLPGLRRMTELMDEECRLYGEAIRDLRWAAMAHLASREPPAKGPMLATPDDVDAYFDALRD